METLLLTVLSVLAFIGLMHLVLSFFNSLNGNIKDMGYKLILCLPQNSDSSLEGIIRRLYLERIPERLMTDGKVYLVIPDNEPEAHKIAETLKKMYPLEALPDFGNVLYDIREKQ